jgi:hypothetical protein
MDDDDDLETYWKDIRRHPVVVTASDRPGDLRGQLLLASEKAGFDLAHKFKEYNGQPVTPELMAMIVAEGIRSFMDKWYDGLRKQNLSGLVEIVLEGQGNHLSPEEMQEFVRALPSSLIMKVVESAMGSATGIHALMALEKHRRVGLANYSIAKVGGSVQVRFTGPEGQEVSFGLYEAFDLDATPPTEASSQG